MNRYEMIISDEMYEKIEKENKNLVGFDSTSLLICVEVPLPSIPSKTIKFLKIIISSKNVCIFSINYSNFLI